MQNHFELFDLAPGYELDSAALEAAYRGIQARVHPDRFAHAGDAERRASMQWTTRVNEAYRTLKSPVQRAKYLLELNGVDVAFETNTFMPREFLMRQMELREALERAGDAKDAAALDALRGELGAERLAMERALGEALDARHDYAGAAGLVRKLMFLEKLDADIDLAYEALEA
jgi:molecular chaperone HscB